MTVSPPFRRTTAPVRERRAGALGLAAPREIGEKTGELAGVRCQDHRHVSGGDRIEEHRPRVREAREGIGVEDRPPAALQHGV